MKFDRDFLQELRGLADEKTEQVTNKHWKRAYLNLSIAADHLDAMEARSTERACSCCDKDLEMED